MCISNALAFRFVLWLKHAYHKYSLNHILLLISYFTFIIVSATIFFLIESFNSDSFRNGWQKKLADERNRFIVNELLPEIFNNTKLLLYIHDQKAQYLTTIMNLRLEYYENQLKLQPPMPALPCTFANSLLFVFSTITTIGYGYIYPVTDGGRALSIICSIIGIPFTIVVIKDLAFLIAKLMNFPCELLARIWAIFRFCTLKPIDENELERKLYGQKVERKDFRLNNTDRLLAIPVTVAVLATVGWTTLGCLIVHAYMPHLSAPVAFYFIFNSLTTIGVGDVEPSDDPVVLLCLFIYLLVGLANISLFINLIHTKFSKAYWLPGRLYMPLRTNPNSADYLASFDSYDEMTMNDCALNHLTTLGVLQAEDKCPLIEVIRKDVAYVDDKTQTEQSIPAGLPPMTSPAPVILPYPRTSQEDVNDLIVETYGARRQKIMKYSTDRKLDASSLNK